MKIKTILAIFLIAALTASSASAAKQEKGAVWASSDGKGTVALFWVPAHGVWPSGGWQLERVSTGRSTVVAKRLMPGTDAEALAAIDAKEAAGIRSFSDKLAAGRLSAQEQALSSAVLGLKAMTDFTYGRALGLRYVDREAGASEVSYRLTALDSSGRPGAVLQSAKLRPDQPTPLPAPFTNLKAAQDNGRVLLTWDMPEQNRDIPTVAFSVERRTADGVDTLTPKPVLVIEPADRKRAAGPNFIDSKPLVEAEATYLVYAVDMFGRRSAAAQAGVFVPDMSSLVPPSQVVAMAEEGRNEITWKLNQSPNTTGYIVERSFLFDGPYENLTPKGLRRTETSFRDTDIMPGTAYYYRVKSVDPRGVAGHPSQAAMAQALGEGQPPAPEGVKAEVGLNRVRITWEPVNYPVAGYFIYRRAGGKDAWFQLNERLTPEPLYDEHFSEQNGATFFYRVVAVGFDSKASRESREVEAVLPDNLPPSPPRIRGADGSKGRAAIQFVPANPESDTRQFLVLRSDNERELGIVISEPLAASARSYEDVFVEPGRTYWYRVAAVDQAGNRSDTSPPVAVLIGTPDIPQPKKPGVSVQKSPFEHVKVTLDPAPFGLMSVVQVKRGGSGWKTLSGPSGTMTDAADANPAKGKVSYRVVYQTSNGAQGNPSEPVEIEIR
ncbi:MAG: hypothetical protein OHK006_13630 [Thermodesulfovibrionales bacterium]